MKKLFNKDLMNKMSRGIHTVGFKLKKHSPEILIGVGVVGTVTSTVMACKATMKIDEILDNTKETVERIHYVAEHPEVAEEKGETYTEQDAKKDLTIAYVKTGAKIAKLYAPSVIIGVASIGCFVGSHRILRKRNIALAAAYTTVERGFKEYRGRVVERFGKELDDELRFNVKAEEVEKTVVNEDGSEVTTKEVVNVADPNAYSCYARFFDNGTPGWTKDPQSNLKYLLLQQNYANDRLKAKGHLFLNEVYDMLGFDRIPDGQIVGWIYDEKNPIGDNFVDFGVFDGNKERARAFVNGDERSILLDFNVDGNIWELM